MMDSKTWLLRLLDGQSLGPEGRIYKELGISSSCCKTAFGIVLLKGSV